MLFCCLYYNGVLYYLNNIKVTIDMNTLYLFINIFRHRFPTKQLLTYDFIDFSGNSQTIFFTSQPYQVSNTNCRVHWELALVGNLCNFCV